MSKSDGPAPSLRGRVADLASKLLSMKGVVFLGGTALLITGKIDASTWLVLALIVVGARTIEKRPWEPRE